MNEYLNVIRNNYVNFTGRARRREYWMFTLINTIIIVVLQGLGVALGFNPYDPSGGSANPLGLILVGLASLYSLAVLLPGLAVSVRRLHDAGFSGWLLLIAFVPFIGGIALLVLTVLDSKPGSNKWGPNPKGVGAPAAPF